MGTDVAVRTGSLDLTRSPAEQWNQDMVDLVARTVFRGIEVTQNQLYFCLSIAESLDLNPLIDEVYFIPSKSKDGKGPALKAYVGRNGLVKKAAERDSYYESDTVREHDKFTMRRKQDGTVTVTHSYGTADRGKIIGAYAFLHFRNGDNPAFFFARWEEYAPTFDAEWKFNASSWGNQESAMIEKCAMIGSGRKRLNLGNLLADGEITRVQQQEAIAPGARTAMVTAGSNEFDFATLTHDAELVDRLRAGAEGAHWPAAKCEMVMTGRADDLLREVAEQLEAEIAAAAPPVPEEPEPEEEEVDAQVVLEPEDDARAELLRQRITDIESRLTEARQEGAETEIEALEEELSHVGAELGALSNPAQEKLL